MFKDNRGSSVIIFIIIFVVLVGFTGLAIDVTNIYYQKQKLQNGTDLAALAAVQHTVKNDGQVNSTGIHYAQKNGIKSSEVIVTHPYNADNYKVEVVASRNINLIFLPLLGYNSKTISARSVAGVNVDELTLFNDIALNYAVFGGSTENNLQIKGNGSLVKGNIHSNDDLEFFGNNHTIEGNLSADEDIRLDDKVTIDKERWTVTPWDKIVPTPTIDFDKYSSLAEHVVNGDVVYNGDLNIDGIWLINGNCHLAGQRISGKGILLVTGSLTISGGTQYETGDDLLAMYAGGDIHISASKGHIVGALFAPNGEIRINGSGNTFYGSLIANNVVWATNETTIHGSYDLRIPQAFTVDVYSYSLFE